MSPDPDPLAAELAGIRHDLGLASHMSAIHVGKQASRLLAAVEAVLAIHVPHEVPSTRICAEHASGPKWRTSATLGEFRDEANACPDCVTTMQTVCAHCDCPNDEWPCPTVQAVAKELLSEEEQ
jgi:hypothetical protein